MNRPPKGQLDPPTLAKRLQAGDPRAAARGITWIENGQPEAAELLRILEADRSKAYRVGITGPPGAGKSTLVNELAGQLHKAGQKVAVLAIDPSSPFSGGALLGDRVRMHRAAAEAEIFIRSMASRGVSGGLSRSCGDACELFDAMGRDYILIETVGAGQLEVDIVSASDTVVVVLNPESGDTVQMMKAGLIEIGDIFAINKADRPGADRLAEQLQSGLQIKDELTPRPWKPPVLLVQALHDKGIDTLLEKIAEHRRFLEANNLLPQKRRQRLTDKVEQLVERHVLNQAWGEDRREKLEAITRQIEQGAESVYSAAEKLVEQLLKGHRP